MLSKERINMGNEESGYGNSGNRIWCCRYLLVFRKVCVGAQLIAASCAGEWSGYHILKIFHFSPSSQLLNVSYLFHLGQKSPLIISLLYSITVLPPPRPSPKKGARVLVVSMYFHKEMCRHLKLLRELKSAYCSVSRNGIKGNDIRTNAE